MIRPIPTRTKHHRLAVTAMQCSFLWTPSLIGQLFNDALDATQAAEAWLTRQERAGYFHSTILHVFEPEIPTEPIVTHTFGQPPENEHQLANILEQRWKKAKPNTVRAYWPSSQFARIYGGWTGTDKLPDRNKASHDLLVSAVWLRVLSQEPTLATQGWTSERELQHLNRCGEHSGPCPDGLITRDREEPLAIEAGGSYPSGHLIWHAARFEQAGYSWQLW